MTPRTWRPKISFVPGTSLRVKVHARTTLISPAQRLGRRWWRRTAQRPSGAGTAVADPPEPQQVLVPQVLATTRMPPMCPASMTMAGIRVTRIQAECRQGNEGAKTDDESANHRSTPSTKVLAGSAGKLATDKTRPSPFVASHRDERKSRQPTTALRVPINTLWWMSFRRLAGQI